MEGPGTATGADPRQVTWRAKPANVPRSLSRGWSECHNVRKPGRIACRGKISR